jgi:hypothetical protein
MTASKTRTRKPAAPKKAATAKPAPVKAEAPKRSTRKDLLARMVELGYTGPTSYTATVLRDVVEWLEAGAPQGNEGIPSGVLYAVHPDLRPAGKGNGEVARLVRDLRRAASDVLKAEDPTEALNVVDGLSAQLREALA